MRKIFFVSALAAVLFSVFACGKEKDGRDAEDEALESFFKPYGDTCFVKYDGIYLYLVEEGGSEYNDGDTVVLVYSGKTLENVVTFADAEVVRTVYPGRDMIEGWRIALRHIRRGSKGILVVPFKKGFGKERTGIIEPFSTLVYAFETE